MMSSYFFKENKVFGCKNKTYEVFRKRSAGRIKTHSSYTDLRAWSLECDQNRQYFMEIMSNAGLPTRLSSSSIDNQNKNDTTTLQGCKAECTENMNETHRDKTCTVLMRPPRSETCCEQNFEHDIVEGRDNVLKTANNLLLEYLNTTGRSSLNFDKSEKHYGHEGRKRIASFQRCLKVIDNLSRQNECLRRISQLQGTCSNKHVKAKLDFLRKRLNWMMEKNKDFDAEYQLFSDDPDCRLRSCMRDLRRENCLLLDYIDFSDRLSEKLAQIQKRYLSLSRNQNLLLNCVNQIESM
nr:PREDICTED: uncharacterized protein LOC109031547 [Bemisia tabaci]